MSILEFIKHDLHCLYCRLVRTLNVVDDFNKEALAMEIDLGMSAEKVVCAGLNSVIARLSDKDENGQSICVTKTC